jgi:hypothetical protein
MVDKLDEGGVQADEGETVQFAAAWTLATPHRVDDRTQPRKSGTVERPFDNDVAVAVELIQHPGDTDRQLSEVRMPSGKLSAKRAASNLQLSPLGGSTARSLDGADPVKATSSTTGAPSRRTRATARPETTINLLTPATASEGIGAVGCEGVTRIRLLALGDSALSFSSAR